MEAGLGIAPGVDVEFLIDAADQRADDIESEVQFGGDFLDPLALGQQAEHVEFPVAEPLQVR
jgi:hypothetical protein